MFQRHLCVSLWCHCARQRYHKTYESFKAIKPPNLQLTDYYFVLHHCWAMEDATWLATWLAAITQHAVQQCNSVNVQLLLLVSLFTDDYSVFDLLCYINVYRRQMSISLSERWGQNIENKYFLINYNGCIRLAGGWSPSRSEVGGTERRATTHSPRARPRTVGVSCSTTTEGPTQDPSS